MQIQVWQSSTTVEVSLAQMLYLIRNDLETLPKILRLSQQALHTQATNVVMLNIYLPSNSFSTTCYLNIQTLNYPGLLTEI